MNIVINNLQEDNARLNSKCSYLENRIELLESTLSRLDQYGGRKKLDVIWYSQYTEW